MADDNLPPPPRSINIFGIQWRDWLYKLYEKVRELINMVDKLGAGDLTLDAWGAQKVVQDRSIFHGMFTFDVPPSMWLVEEDGVEIPVTTSTRAVSVSGMLQISSGATATNTCHLESRRHPRYQPDRGLKWAASAGFKDASLDGVLKAGLIVDSENGVYFKTKGDGKLYACVMNDGVETHEEEIVFLFDIDITKGNIYDIQMQWRGVGNMKFYAGNPSTGLLSLVHTITFLNTLDEELSIRNPAMSLGFHAENVSQEVGMWCGCVDVTSEGGDVDREQYGEYSEDNTVSAGTTTAIGSIVLAIRNPTTAPNGKINTRDLRLARITITASKKATYKVYQTRDTSAITATSWDTFKTGSFVEKATTITAVDTSLMEEFSTFKNAAAIPNEKVNPASETIDFFSVHGDYIVVAITSGSTVITEASIEWGEEI